MELNDIIYERDQQLAIIKLNRPDTLNSFTAAMHEELAQVMQEVESDPDIRAVLLTGMGRGFCAGQDLNDRATSPELKITGIL